MSDKLVRTFFYGSYINSEVLKQLNFTAIEPETAKLYGYDIVIKPIANLIKSDGGCVYGILASSTHSELNRLYSLTKEIFGVEYLPEPVLVETINGKFVPALCYICPEIKEVQATNEYVDKIFHPAKKSGFPQWYLNKLNSFRPAGPRTTKGSE